MPVLRIICIPYFDCSTKSSIIFRQLKGFDLRYSLFQISSCYIVNKLILLTEQYYSFI